MKKIISLILTAVLVCGMIGCTGGQTGQTGQENGGAAVTGFRVGYGKVEITPRESVPLQGFGNVTQRMSTGFLDRLYTVCIAITDADDNTVLLYGNDLTTSVDTITDLVRQSVTAATGVPGDHIMLSASHTHSAPATNSTTLASQVRYNQSLVEWMTEAAVMAMEDRKTAEMYVGSVEIEGQNFVRHYVLSDGTSVGYDNMARGKDPISHAGIGDHTMQFVKFQREGGKDVLMTNWQAHPTRTGSASDYDASADIVGILRSTLEQELDCLAVYYQGAAGNMNAISFVPDEEVSEDYREQGRQIAQFVIDGADSLFTKVQTGKVQTLQVSHEAKIDHSDDGLLTFARQVQQIWNSTNNREKADAAGAPYGIRSPYHANKIISVSKKGETGEMELNAIAIGDVAFVVGGFEMFAENGIHVKDNSPYEMTFMIGYANESNGYLPAAESFEYVGYERDVTSFVSGTGEQVAQHFVDMLNRLKSES